MIDIENASKRPAFRKLVTERVKLYKKHHFVELELYLADYRRTNIRDLVYRATHGLYLDGKAHDHQKRVSKQAKLQMQQAILPEIQFILVLKDFHSFWTFIDKLRVKGYGDLAVYDCALRLASVRHIQPDQYVYLHEDTKTGAERLLGRPLSGVRFIEPDELYQLYPSLKKLPLHHLENFLCIYADDFIDEDTTVSSEINP